jgi:hypothetical protein
MPDAPEPKKTCFIAMPISTPEQFQPIYGHGAEHFLNVLDHLFRPAIAQSGLECISPISDGSEIIHADIIQNLIKADLVLCDCLTLNANVFFELGIRTAMNKPICIIKDNKTLKIPFDITTINHHTYDPSLSLMNGQAEVAKLSEHINKSLGRSNGKNSMWTHFGLKIAGEIPVGPHNQADKLDIILQMVESLAQKERKPSSKLAGIGFPNVSSPFIKMDVEGASLTYISSQIKSLALACGVGDVDVTLVDGAPNVALPERVNVGALVDFFTQVKAKFPKASIEM